MKQAKSGDALIGDRIGEGKMVPFYSVGIDEWREVPGALPNMLVILASSRNDQRWKSENC
jgi:hypothetical protein